MVGIDFTASNGNPGSKSSFHHFGPNNQYLKTLEALVSVTAYFDQEIHVYGLGAVPKHMGDKGKEVSHCFPLNGHEEKPSVSGLAELIEIYRTNTPAITFSGPTLITPILQKLYDQLVENKTQKMYRVLVLLLDGDIDDYHTSLSLLIKLSALPCSIILIGIGNGSFSKLSHLNKSQLWDYNYNINVR